jgi:amidophosphoribosyltransferase
MGGLFGVVSESDCVADLYYGTDYHSHLGTRYGAAWRCGIRTAFDRSIHNIENNYFRTKFESDLQSSFKARYGIGVISDTDPAAADHRLPSRCNFAHRNRRSHQ